MTMSRTLRFAALAAATVLALTGCASQGPEQPTEPTVEPSNGEPTSSPTIPSDWQSAEMAAAAVHLPPDWTLLDTTPDSTGFASPQDDFGFSAGGGTLALNVATDAADVKAYVDRSAKSLVKSRQSDPSIVSVKRRPDVTINGVLFAHVEWETSQTWDSEYLTVSRDGASQVVVVWQFTKGDLDRKGAQALIDPVMDTFELL